VEFIDILKVKNIKVLNNKKKGFAVITEITNTNPFTEFDLN
jgi:hypothetical protein